MAVKAEKTALLHLCERRSASVRDFVSRYKKGVLFGKYYLKSTSNGPKGSCLSQYPGKRGGSGNYGEIPFIYIYIN